MSADIRLVCIQQLGAWLKTYPAFWLNDGSLKYAGWMLNDKDAGVRGAAAGSIGDLLDLGDDSIAAKTRKFLARFLKRFTQMTNDVDEAVAALAVKVLSQILELGELGEHDGETVPQLLWDHSADVRRYAAEFVFKDSFADDLEKADHAEEITQLLNVMDKHCPIMKETGQRGGERGERARARASETCRRSPPAFFRPFVFLSRQPTVSARCASSTVPSRTASLSRSLARWTNSCRRSGSCCRRSATTTRSRRSS